MRLRAARCSLGTVVLGLATIWLAACTAAPTPEVEAAVLWISLPGCQQNTSSQATATVIGDGLALTVAHSFEDASAVNLTTPTGAEVTAELVYVDRERDIALVSFDGLGNGEALEISNDGDDPAAKGRIVVQREDSVVVQPVELLRRTAVTLDGEGRRQGIELAGEIEPGDSGAPVVDEDGRMIGMVFASSRVADTGWAVAGSELVDIASLAAEPIPLTCPTGAGG